MIPPGMGYGMPGMPMGMPMGMMGYGMPMGMMGYGMPTMPGGMPRMPGGMATMPGQSMTGCPVPGMMPGYGPPQGWPSQGHTPGASFGYPGAQPCGGGGGGVNSLWEEKMAQLQGRGGGGASSSKWDQQGSGGASKWDIGGPPEGDGKVLYGKVKSYSSLKGYGFIVTQEIDQDVFFAEQSLAPEMRASDLNGLVGNSVNIELMRAPDGKPQARRVWFARPAAPSRPSAHPGVSSEEARRLMKIANAASAPPLAASGARMPPMHNQMMMPPKPSMKVAFLGRGGAAVAFNPSGTLGCRDGSMVGVGKPSTLTPAQILAASRGLSPHAGSRAMGGSANAPVAASRSRSRKRPRSSSSRSSSSSSSSSSRRKRKQKKKKDKRSEGGEAPEAEAASAAAESGEIAQAKADALQKLTGLQKIEPKDARMKAYRALLRLWHPDKNPDRLEVATAVFQFLQKGKKLIAP